MNALTHRASVAVRRAAPEFWTAVALLTAGAVLGGLAAGVAQGFAARRRAAQKPKPDPEAVDVWKNEGGSTTAARAVAVSEGNPA